MGTLAAIAIPAYNEYRKSAKKTAYKSDIQSLYKGWNAFSVELDSYCERETTPDIASFSNVGMRTLLTSNLYGNRSALAARCACPAGATCTPACALNAGSTACTAASSTNCVFHPARPAGSGPGKNNFIGFGAETCPNITGIVDGDLILRDAVSRVDTDCDLTPTSFKMGSFGYVGGNDYISYSIVHTGVLVENEGSAGSAWITSGDVGDSCT